MSYKICPKVARHEPTVPSSAPIPKRWNSSNFLVMTSHHVWWRLVASNWIEIKRLHDRRRMNEINGTRWHLHVSAFMNQLITWSHAKVPPRPTPTLCPAQPVGQAGAGRRQGVYRHWDDLELLMSKVPESCWREAIEKRETKSGRQKWQLKVEDESGRQKVVDRSGRQE